MRRAQRGGQVAPRECCWSECGRRSRKGGPGYEGNAERSAWCAASSSGPQSDRWLAIVNLSETSSGAT